MPTNIKSKKPQQKPNQPKLTQPKLNQPKPNQPKPKRSAKESDGESVKTQNTGTNVSIQISDCEITHPNMPSSSSLENLIPQKSPAKKGFTNPSFSIDTVSSDDSILGITSSSNTTDVAVVGTLPFRGARRGSYNSDGASIRKLNLAQQRRGSYTSSNTIDGSGQLRVPRPMDLRKSNDQNAGKESKFIGQLSPLPSGSDNFNFNGNSLPPPSPGFYGNGFDLHPPPSPGLLSTNSAWSELGKLHSRRSSYGDFSMDSMGNRTCADTMSNVSSSLSQYLHDLVRAFSSRTEKIKETTVQPPTPSSLSEYDAFSDANSAISNPEDLQRTHRINSFIPGEFAQPEHTETENNRYYMDWGCCKSRAPKFCRWLKFPNILEPQSKLYMCWLALVTACFMYNAWAIPLRGVFPYQTKDNISYWLACDYFCDLIYLLDILVFKPRVTFLNHGITETDIRLTRKYYWKKSMFKFDFLSLLPLDLFYLLTGVVPWLRLPRVLKIQTFWEFYERCDQAVRSAHILRIIKTMTYMLFLIHVETCGYYAVSVYEGIGTNRWVYSGEGIAYIRCFYLATKTATSIGNNPHPTNTMEYIFMTVYWVSGVFVFALLIGQIRDIAEAAGRVKALYNKRMDAALWYVKSLNLPKETQDKVRTWFVYNWQQQKIIDEKQLMDTLPKNLRTDLAIQVHFNTLSKVKLFQDCDKSLLLDLVLKLKAILYLPGDFVCRKGEVGKEMYIVSQGLVEVLGGPDNSVVLATLKEGSVFGEISLLALGGEGNRRTADVRCKGFTNLFVLLKEDFEAAMSEYPEAHKHMKKRAKKLLRQNARLKKISDDTTATSKVEEIIKQSVHTETPKMVKTVIQVLNPESQVGKKLRAKSYDSNMVEHGTLPNMSLPHIKIKSESDMEETSASNKEEITPTENKLELKKPKRSQSLPMPTDQEVEDFFDEILAVEVIPSSDFDELQAQELKRQLSLEDHHEPMTEVKKGILKRDDTLQTENSEESADSGVQVFKATSPTESSSKATSNQDSKESFLSNDTADVFKDTKSWVANQNKELELSKTDEYLNRIFEESLDLDKEIQELKDVLEETEPSVSKTKEENSLQKVEEQNSPKNENTQIPSKNEDGDILQNNKEVIQEPNRSNTIVITPAKDDNVLVLKPEPQKKISDLSPTVNDISRKRQRALSIFSDDSSDFGKGETLIDFIANDVRENNGNVKGQPNEVKANGIPPSNQITCSVEVHREKSITPASITEWLDVGMSQNNNMRKRKESVVTPPTDLKYYESSV